jgi:hypothetical protein
MTKSRLYLNSRRDEVSKGSHQRQILGTNHIAWPDVEETPPGCERAKNLKMLLNFDWEVGKTLRPTARGGNRCR